MSVRVLVRAVESRGGAGAERTQVWPRQWWAALGIGSARRERSWDSGKEKEQDLGFNALRPVLHQQLPFFRPWMNAGYVLGDDVRDLRMVVFGGMTL